MDSIRRTLIMPRPLYQRVEEVADQDRRSVNKQIECLIEEALDRRASDRHGKAEAAE